MPGGVNAGLCYAAKFHSRFFQVQRLCKTLGSGVVLLLLPGLWQTLRREVHLLLEPSEYIRISAFKTTALVLRPTEKNI